ncbi:flagellar hook assembly protein FlgD [Microterricola viridarii]|uniref:Flagellar basal-body rod modification protein FlgD n=1 Tax=Microterricola viridarii TaxID=412690 RepID=A0A1H1W407_9MICO|nr:flagellar hook capping FlgD N-terminal domain-containing protein [Microterricola viridarii]SDS91793.1 flagellar basal-body rod modification protein FlgD [Microterricola viridarii]
MPIDPIATARGGIYTNAPVRAPKQDMDGEVFMSLLVTQLQNQDPSSPMDTGQMIQQTTQLAMMEKMNELAVTSAEGFSLQMRSAAAALVGQQVTYVNATGETITGIADSVSYAGAVPTVSVGGKNIPLDVIASVTKPPAVPPVPDVPVDPPVDPPAEPETPGAAAAV